jgi:hypothetical protein
MVVYTYNSSTQEAEAGRSKVWSQPEHSKSMSQKYKIKELMAQASGLGEIAGQSPRLSRQWSSLFWPTAEMPGQVPVLTLWQRSPPFIR